MIYEQRIDINNHQKAAFNEISGHKQVVEVKGVKGDQGDKGDTGNGIVNIQLIATEDRRKTYRINFDDGSHYDYYVLDGEKGDPGAPFVIWKTYASIAAMNAGYSTDNVPIGGFVIIDSGDVEDPDNSKLFLKNEQQYSYVTDLSGAQGIKGETGNGISSIALTGTVTDASAHTKTDTYTIYFTNGSSFSYQVISFYGYEFDNAPTSGSVNLLTSGTVKTALDQKQNNLPQSYLDYLYNATYQVPTATLTPSVAAGSKEYGTTIQGTFSHRETNVDNISGTLTLLRNVSSVDSSVKTGIAKSASNVQIDGYNVSETLTKTVKFRLQFTDTNGTTRNSEEVTYSVYKPVFYGALSSSTISSSAQSSLTKKASSSFGTISFDSASGQYGWLVTAGTISKVTSGGFEVPMEVYTTVSFTLNGKTVTYKAYRTSNPLGAGTNTFIIT